MRDIPNAEPVVEFAFNDAQMAYDDLVAAVGATRVLTLTMLLIRGANGGAAR
jgi:hypothetical protein